MSDTDHLAVFRLAIVASAIAGRPLTIQLAPGRPTFTDGTSVAVDPAADLRDIRDAVAMQAALLAVGALRRDVMSRLARHRPGIAGRYLSLELARAGMILEDVLPGATLERLKSAGVECRTVTPDESFEQALGRTPVPLAPAWAGTVHPARLRRIAAADLAAAPTDADLSRLDELKQEDDDSDAEDDAADEESKIVNLLSVPGLSNPLGEALQKLLGMGRRGQDKSQGAGEIPVSGKRFGSVGADARRFPLDLLNRAVSSVFVADPITGVRYPEWDCHRDRYLLDWCSVTEYDPVDRDDGTDLAVSGGTLHRVLARVGAETERHRRQRDGDSLDMSAVVDYAVHRTIGENPEPAVYENVKRTRRELSILVLLDCSGSTAENSGGHVVFDEERELAGQLTAALERLGDRVATVGFYSRGRGAVTFLRIKDFNARFDSTARRRLRSVQPSGFTRTGAAIRHATHLLESQARAKNMVLVVVGDGMPYDDGYEDRYARADVRRAIEEAIHRGIGVVGLGIRSSTEPAVLQEVWSDAPFRVVDDIGDVQRNLRSLMTAALAATRSNGRRRDIHTAAQQLRLRSATATGSRWNSYG